MACKYCEELNDYLNFNTEESGRAGNFEEDEPNVALTELYFKYLGFDSRWYIPVNFCPNCGEKIN